MAAFNKLGSLLRHSTLTSGAPASSSPALFNAARLMSTKLFVGGLSWGTDEQTLRQAFSSFGEVTEARIITDRETGRSRGFGFVNFSNSDDAKEAVSQMDGQVSETSGPVFQVCLLVCSSCLNGDLKQMLGQDCTPLLMCF
jgi:RNA recognition motif-containing protein